MNTKAFNMKYSKVNNLMLCQTNTNLGQTKQTFCRNNFEKETYYNNGR